MIKNAAKLKKALVDKARVFGAGCQKVYVAGSGGVDSSLVIAVLCEAFGPKNVVVVYRDIKSNPKHWADIRALQAIFKFRLCFIDANKIYDQLLAQLKKQFEKIGLPWAKEGTAKADKLGFTSAYASLKSRLTTPISGFVAKAIDNGGGRIFGTGNGEEDGLLRYFDKYGDGAVDNNLLSGLTKAEVRQLAAYLGVPAQIVTKIPSADLEACGDKHNDESQLTAWARQLGLDIKISYGSPDGSAEGNIAWGWKQDRARGVITGRLSRLTAEKLKERFKYTKEEAEVILFLRAIEKATRHKVEPIPGLDRRALEKSGLVG